MWMAKIAQSTHGRSIIFHHILHLRRSVVNMLADLKDVAAIMYKDFVYHSQAWLRTCLRTWVACFRSAAPTKRSTEGAGLSTARGAEVDAAGAGCRGPAAAALSICQARGGVDG